MEDTTLNLNTDTKPVKSLSDISGDINTELNSLYEPESKTIMSSYNASREQINKASEAAKQLAESKFTGAQKDELVSGERNINAAKEDRRGFSSSPVYMSLLAEQTTKRIDDLTRQKKELLLSNEYEKASALSKLIVDEQTALTNARSRILNEIFATKAESRAEAGFQTPEQKSVMDLANKFPDAGITSSDTFESAQAKATNSESYQRDSENSKLAIEQARATLDYTRAQTRKLGEPTKEEIQAAKDKQQVQEDALSTLNLINTIIDSGNIESVAGFGRSVTGSFLNTAETRAQLKNLAAQLTLEKRQLLKGQGSISDFEAKVLGNAASALAIDPESGKIELSNADAVKQLNQVKGVFQTAAGLDANIELKDPNTGEKTYFSANREEINNAISQGYLVTYIGDISTPQTVTAPKAEESSTGIGSPTLNSNNTSNNRTLTSGNVQNPLAGLSQGYKNPFEEGFKGLSF